MGELTALLRPIAGLRGPASKGEKEGTARGKGKGEEGK